MAKKLTDQERIERLEDLYCRNDEIERALAKIERHGRRASYTDSELDEKWKLQNELNNVIVEIERIEGEANHG